MNALWLNRTNPKHEEVSMARKKITDEQLQEELNAGMKNIDIARKYGISDRVIRIRKAKLAKKGVGHGRDVSHLVPDGYKIKGTSSLVDELGNTKLQWVKTDTDAERQVELMKAVIEGMKSEITPLLLLKPFAPNETTSYSTFTLCLISISVCWHGPTRAAMTGI
ncbi:hypothetical protein [Escherichia phage CR01]|nr:hypothetical protein [Escherichia phage CR01]